MSSKTWRKRAPSWIAAAAVLALLGAGYFLIFHPGRRQAPGSAIQMTQGRELTLYFMSAADGKYARRPLRVQENLPWADQIKNIIENMFEKSAAPGEASLWPFQLRVRSVYLLAAGTLVLDLEEGVQYNQAVSAASELGVARSLVHTLLSNFPEVRSVKFLINGSEAETLAGHIDISRVWDEND